MSTTARTDIPTEIIECSCRFCAEYAERKGLTLPLRAEVNVKMLAKIGSAKGRHNLVQSAITPVFGRYGEIQARFGPWAV